MVVLKPLTWFQTRLFTSVQSSTIGQLCLCLSLTASPLTANLVNELTGVGVADTRIYKCYSLLFDIYLSATHIFDHSPDLLPLKERSQFQRYKNYRG